MAEMLQKGGLDFQNKKNTFEAQFQLGQVNSLQFLFLPFQLFGIPQKYQKVWLL